MTGRKDKSKARDVADPSDFLDTYFRERGIKRNIDSVAISDCVRRAEEARESFKRMRAPAEPDPLVPGATGALSDAQKYSRRLLNNRKSAAATRVYQEVLKKEQAHTLDTVVNERDRYAAELARANAERTKVEQEAAELRALVKQLTSEKVQVPSGLGRLTATIAPVHAPNEESRTKMDVASSQERDMKLPTIAPALYVPNQCSQMKMEITESQEQDIKMLPALDPISSQREDIEQVEANTKSLRISFKAGEAFNLGMMSSQSSQETDAKVGSEGTHSGDSGFKLPLSSQDLEVRSMPMSTVSKDMSVMPPKIVLDASQERKAGGECQEKVQCGKFPIGSGLRVGVLNSQSSQGGMPVNLRFSLASQDVEAVEEVFPPSQTQNGTPMKCLRPLGRY